MPHVFISYVREDTRPVDRLCDSLRENGIKIWMDRNDIPPGMRWKKAIRKAINEGDFFIACFSPSYISKGKTYMNEELTLAIEILRQKPIDRAWFIPVLLAECEVPDRDIGAGETLLDIQQVRLYENWGIGIKQILSVIKSDATVEGDTISVLFLGANPSDTTHPRVNMEVTEIQSKILSSELRDRFEVVTRTAGRLEDLQKALLTVQPRIVHFTGHKMNAGRLVLEDNVGRSIEVNTNALASLFKMASDRIDCVILNVSYSSKLAQAIAKEVKYVIGISEAISDKAAITFAAAFYQSLAAGRSIEEAFKFGSAAIKLEGISGAGKPVLIMRG
jgi:TIR domain-containing protein/CHAT domain-containing protein